MASSLLIVSIMTQIDLYCFILLFYIFLRNVMAFDKELAILYGFFNLRISEKLLFLKKALMGPNIYLNFVINQSRNILLVPRKYTLEN